jgi:hypothetical protein
MDHLKIKIPERYKEYYISHFKNEFQRFFGTDTGQNLWDTTVDYFKDKTKKVLVERKGFAIFYGTDSVYDDVLFDSNRFAYALHNSVAFMIDGLKYKEFYLPFRTITINAAEFDLFNEENFVELNNYMYVIIKNFGSEINRIDYPGKRKSGVVRLKSFLESRQHEELITSIISPLSKAELDGIYGREFWISLHANCDFVWDVKNTGLDTDKEPPKEKEKNTAGLRRDR